MPFKRGVPNQAVFNSSGASQVGFKRQGPLMLQSSLDKDLSVMSNLLSQESRQLDSKYRNIASLKRKRIGLEPIAPAMVVESDHDIEEQLDPELTQMSLCVNEINKDETYGEGLKDEELSPLKHFMPISVLLQRGGDAARRVEFILEMFGRSVNSDEGAGQSKRGRKSPSKVPGLNPSRASAPQSYGKRRLGNGRLYKRNE
jgi:hypothetical protein